MAPSLVQSVSGTITSGTTLTITLAATGQGNCLVVYVGEGDSTTNPVVSGITLGGAAGNFFAAKTAINNADLNDERWVDWNIPAGQTSVVITFTLGSGGNQGCAAWVEEWSGIQNTSNPVDKTNGANGNSTAPSSGSSGVLTQPSELVTGSICDTAAITGPGAPWTNQAPLTAGALVNYLAGHQVVSATTAQTYSGSTGAAAPWGAVIVTLKAAPPSGGGTPAPAPPGRQSPPVLGLSAQPVQAPQSPPSGQATPVESRTPPGLQSPMALGVPLTAPSPAPQSPPTGQATPYPLTPPGRQSPVSLGLGLTAPNPAPQTPPVGQATPQEALIPPGLQSPIALSSYLTPGNPQPPPAPVIPPQPALAPLTPPGRMSPMSLGLGLYAPSPAPQTPPVVPPAVRVFPPPQGRDDKPHLKKLLLLLE